MRKTIVASIKEGDELIGEIIITPLENNTEYSLKLNEYGVVLRDHKRKKKNAFTVITNEKNIFTMLRGILSDAVYIASRPETVESEC